MSAPQTNSEFPKKGARTRLAAISTPRRTAPERKTATPIARPPARRGGSARRGPRPFPPLADPASGGLVVRSRATHELLHGGREVGAVRQPGHEDRVDPGALERDH